MDVCYNYHSHTSYRSTQIRHKIEQWMVNQCTDDQTMDAYAIEYDEI